MKRFIKTALTASLVTLAVQTYAADTTNSSVTPAERTKIETVVREYLLQNPEVLVESLQNFQKKQYEQAEKTVKQTQQIASQYANPLFHQANDPIAGNPNGKLTVVEFFDYQCPHCMDMAPVMTDIIKANPDVRVIYKEFPIRGPLSDMAARAALAANKQGKYSEFSHLLLTSKAPLTEAGIYKTAQDAGLNVDQLKKDMNDKSIQDQLKANVKLAQDLKLFGTPAFFIGKTAGTTITYIPGRMNQQQMQEVLNKANQ